MYCRYTKTNIWEHKQCPLNGGEFYCVLYLECPLSDISLYIMYNQLKTLDLKLRFIKLWLLLFSLQFTET